MALPRRLLLAAVTVAFLLGLYICVNLEKPLTWPTGGLRFHGDAEWEDSLSQDPEDPETRTRDPPTPVLQENKPGTQKPPAPPAATTVGAGGSGTVAPVAPVSTESSFFGDSYMREEIPRQTTCPTSLRTRVPHSELRDQFLSDIPVLQSPRHLTPDQYRRLSQWGGAYGWVGVDYHILNETLSLLDFSNSQMFDDWSDRRNGSVCIRCAVVGNGGILNASRRGAEIDGHHYVFRTNGAIIEGFQEDVGSRTTHYLFSTNTMMNSLSAYRDFNGPHTSPEMRYVFLPDHDRDYLLLKAAATHTKVDRGRDQGKDPTRYFGDVSVKQLKILHPDFVRYLRNRFLRSKTLYSRQRDIYRPSTGAAMLLAALHTCDQVSAYGYMTPDWASYSNHYFDRDFHKVAFYVNHDYRLEMNLWQRLHRDQLLRLYMRQQEQQGADRK